MTLDEGRIEGPAGSAPLCELELEFRDGDPADLFVLAQALAEAVPLRLGVMAKSARGFALIDGAVSGPCKAEPVALPEVATTAEAFRRVARACLRHMRLNERVFLEAARDPDALHQMRVALRRLRSALSLFAPLLEADPRAASFADEIQAGDPALRAGAQPRRIPGRDAAGLDEGAVGHAGARRPARPGRKSDRARAYDAVLAILESPEWRGLLLDLVAGSRPATGPDSRRRPRTRAISRRGCWSGRAAG